MFRLSNFISRFQGLEVQQVVRNDKVLFRVSGFHTRWLLSDIERMYGTSRTSYLFHKVTSYYIELHSFFVLEFDRALTELQDPKRRRSSAWIAKRIQDALRRVSWLKNLETPDEDIPKRIDLRQLKKFRYQPLDYQMQLLKEYDARTWKLFLNGLLLDAVMGSGKTLMYLYVAECLNPDHIVIISPNNAMDQVWTETISNKLTYQPTVWRSDRNVPFTNQRYLLVHYEGLQALLELLPKLADKRVVVGVDECHNFNDLNSLRTQRLVEFCRGLPNRDVIMQSGTIFKAIGSEIIAATYCIDPNFTEDMAESFKRLYSASARGALQLLQYRLDFITYKVVASQVNLGEPVTQTDAIKTPDAQEFTLASVLKAMRLFTAERIAYYEKRASRDHAIYHRVIEQHKAAISSKAELVDFAEYQRCVEVIRRGDLMSCRDEIVAANRYENQVIIPRLSREDAVLFKEVKTIYKYVRLKIQGECLGQVVGRLRMQASISIVNALQFSDYIESTTKKTLFYTGYVEVLQRAVERVKEEGYEPLAVYGATNKDLAEIIRKFEKEAQYNPLMATFHSLSTAVPMTMADTMVMIDVPWRGNIYNQTVARIHRIGKNTQTRVFVLRLDTGDEPNISTRTVDILQWSQAQVELITGTKSPFQIEDKKVSLEAAIMSKRPLELVEDGIEEAYLRPLV